MDIELNETIYLASPYNHESLKVRHMRLRVVNSVARQLISEGRLVYSPLTHNVPIDNLGERGSWDTWKRHDLNMLCRCDVLLVLRQEGWEKSPGVAGEVEYAEENQKRIVYMDPPATILEMVESIPEGPFEELLQKQSQIFTDRDWHQFHSPKNLAISLIVEAAELAEKFTWLSEEESYSFTPSALEKVKDEVGDVFLVLNYLAHSLGINLLDAAGEKIEKICLKYPVELCKGKNLKYTELEGQNNP
ncbi:MAG: hypothetical protein S4CHLAM102_13510 [Chlamydiia bacterium]|nr:hypothetical protein [Chlamydiia bacterium]